MHKTAIKGSRRHTRWAYSALTLLQTIPVLQPCMLQPTVALLRHPCTQQANRRWGCPGRNADASSCAYLSVQAQREAARPEPPSSSFTPTATAVWGLNLPEPVLEQLSPSQML